MTSHLFLDLAEKHHEVKERRTVLQWECSLICYTKLWCGSATLKLQMSNNYSTKKRLQILHLLQSYGTVKRRRFIISILIYKILLCYHGLYLREEKEKAQKWKTLSRAAHTHPTVLIHLHQSQFVQLETHIWASLWKLELQIVGKNDLLSFINNTLVFSILKGDTKR